MSFFQGGNQSTNTDQQQQAHNQEDWVAKVVQEKGDQWSDPQTLAKGYASSQEFIAQLEAEKKAMEEELSKKNYVDDLLKQLQAGQAQPPAGEPAKEQGGTNSQEQTAPELSDEKLTSLIEQTLTQREQTNTAAQNLAMADAKLQELFGTEVEKEMEKRGKEVGMTKERLQEIAAESPSAFFKLIGEKVERPTNPTVQGSVNTSAGFNSQSSERNWAYYSKLRKEDPQTYRSPAIQNQMLADKQRLGADFGN